MNDQAKKPDAPASIDPFYVDGKAKRSVAIIKAKEKFCEINSAAKLLDWTTEENFAIQAVESNKYITSIAESNPAALYRAMINLSTIGLTLNPALGLAYLVPRDNKICLDISYKGLVKLATDTGSIRWVQSKVVFSNEKFVLRGISEAPLHESVGENAFVSNRGEMVGVYCTVRTSDGDYLTDIMSKDDIDEIMKRSQAWKSVAAGKSASSPWHSDYNEMAKKTVVKRASKLWPKTERADRLDFAIKTINEHEGIDFVAEQEKQPEPVQVEYITEEQELTLIAMLQDKGIDIARPLKYYAIEKLSLLPKALYDEFIALIEKTVSKAQ